MFWILVFFTSQYCIWETRRSEGIYYRIHIKGSKNYRQDQEGPSTCTRYTHKLEEKYKARNDQHRIEKLFNLGDRGRI